MQIIVQGMHRCGTSLVTRLINMMGAYVVSDGGSLGFNDENPKGFWERRDVVECNDAILAHLHCTWEELADWPEGALPELPDALDARIKNILLDLDAHRPWVMKDPRLALTFPYWNAHLEVPVIVSVTRDPLEVAASLETRNPAMRAHVGVALWERYTLSILAALGDAPVIHAQHAQALADPVAFTKTLHDALEAKGVRGLSLPAEKEILAFIEPKLYRSKPAANYAAVMNAQQIGLMERARGGASPAAPVPALSQGAREALAAYTQLRRLERYAVQLRETLTAQLAQCQEDVRDARARLFQAEADRATAEKELAITHASLRWRVVSFFVNAVRRMQCALGLRKSS